MACGFEETIENRIYGDGPDDVTVRADITWKNLGFWKKYKLFDLNVIGTQNMIINPWFDATGMGYKRVYENCSVRKMPDDALVYAITARCHDADTGDKLYGSNYQWGMYGGQKVVFCRPCCDLNNIYIYTYKWRPVTDGTCGLSVYGSDGTIIYNSNFKYLKIKSTRWSSGYGNRYIRDKPGVAVTMPFGSVSFHGKYSNYPDARYFLSSYKNGSDEILGELSGVLIGDDLKYIDLPDTYYFDVPYSQIDVANL